MRVLSLTVALMSAASAPALAASESQTCTRGTDIRTIEVLSPGKVGKACDLNVIRDNGAYVSTPYHANQSVGFCASRAEEIVAGLARDGFACETTPSPVAAADPAPAPDASLAAVDESAAAPESSDAMEALIAKSTAPVARPQTAAATPSPESAPEAQTAAATVAAEPTPAESTIQTPVAAAPPVVTAPDAVASTEPIADDAAATHTLEQPPVAAAPAEAEEQKFANAGPVALSPTNASALKGVRAPRSAAGRFVGADADAKPLDAVDGEVEERLGAQPTTPAAPIAPAATASAPAASPVPVSAPVAAAPAPKARAAEDIIRSVLAAQTAAWNDGDLEAFMGVYWKDAELRFVSDGTISKGWKETMSRFRNRYGEGPAMGRLALDNLDIELVSDDVATVVGRYRLARAEATEVGLFTFVLKRFDGLWRIVHDHSTADTPRTN